MEAWQGVHDAAAAAADDGMAATSVAVPGEPSQRSARRSLKTPDMPLQQALALPCVSSPCPWHVVPIHRQCIAMHCHVSANTVTHTLTVVEVHEYTHANASLILPSAETLSTAMAVSAVR
ncbi:uncharacterized protein ColSpa_02106 [Colletotrichum spaethianum]|uniref:Uncharacterized protein n=1 Tax=Colletotrichum spaethianum TaxID=700344 RepID=A0AA37L895_9PEZI|nr:uncharacterized protein ColSpa_02106 [Colletotrichum spaethianum]GKT41925.1 hypothetical protein ColSpa_02106 [Colletotrichum spaethianum]